MQCGSLDGSLEQKKGINGAITKSAVSLLISAFRSLLYGYIRCYHAGKLGEGHTGTLGMGLQLLSLKFFQNGKFKKTHSGFGLSLSHKLDSRVNMGNYYY